MSQWTVVKDQLLSQGENHFVFISASGDVLACSGDFENSEKQMLANSIIQQCSALMGPEEKLKRVTMAFADYVYIATTLADTQGRYGVVVKRSAEAATS